MTHRALLLPALAVLTATACQSDPNPPADLQFPIIVATIDSTRPDTAGYRVSVSLQNSGTGAAFVDACFVDLQRNAAGAWTPLDNVAHNDQCADDHATVPAGARAQLSWSARDLAAGDSVRFQPRYGGIPGGYPMDFKPGSPSAIVVVP